MFNVARRRRTSSPSRRDGQQAVSYSDAALTWDVLLNVAKRDKPELEHAISAARSLELDPSDLRDLSLVELTTLLPAVPPPILLGLRKITRDPPSEGGQVSTYGIERPRGLQVHSFFVGKLLAQDAAAIGNERLGMWFEVTLLMATLLFSLALTLTVSAPTSCANPDDADACDVLLLADQLVWCSMSVLLWMGCFMLWGGTLIVILLPPSEVRRFVSNNIRVTFMGPLITILGVMLFGPGLALRVWLLATTRTPQLVVLILASVGTLILGVLTSQLLATTGGEPLSAREVALVMLGGFGLLPGCNRLQYVSGGSELQITRAHESRS